MLQSRKYCKLVQGSGNKGNFGEVLASLILSIHECLTTVNIQKRIICRHCYISFLQAQEVPNNFIQLYAELMKSTTKPHCIGGNRKRQYYQPT